MGIIYVLKNFVVAPKVFYWRDREIRVDIDIDEKKKFEGKKK